jgi:hypothetical protein
MKDDAHRMPAPRMEPAYPMAHVDLICPASTAHRPMMNRKNDALPLTKRNYFGARLHARALLGQHEFAASEVLPLPREQKRDLQRKDSSP